MPYANNDMRLRALKGNFGSSKVTGAPGTIYVALLRNPTDPATVLGTEPDGSGSYGRFAISNIDAEWTYGAVSVSNTNEMRFPTATGLYSITDPLNQWALYDNSAGGTLLVFGQLTSTITITGAGDVPVIPAGQLVLTEDA